VAADVDDVPVTAAGVVTVLDPDAPDDPEPPVEVDADSRAVVRARSSWDTCLMSAATFAWAEEAWARAAEQLDVPPPVEGVVVEVVLVEVVDVVEVVVVEFPHAAVAAWRLVPARAESLSSCDWSETRVDCRVATDDEEDEGDDPPAEPDAVVAPVEEAACDEVVEVVAMLVVVVAVSLASALASEAWAEASEAWAESTAALSVATSSDARVWPWVTTWPTETSTLLTVPEASKLRLAWLTGVMVPTESRVARTVPVPTAAVR
jgi:hypothetical protein